MVLTQATRVGTLPAKGRGMDQFNVMQVKAAIDVAFKILAHRFLRVLGLLMTFGLFMWAMFQASWIHYTVAGSFGLFIFLPILFVTTEKNDGDV